MLKQRLISLLAFILVWLTFSWLAGIFSHMHELPRSVHQSAQCDRASLAQNYYYGGFRFLYPEVNEHRCVDGIVSCELPFTNYLAAFLYKLFGYDETWFRLLSFICISAGMYALFLLFRLFMNTLASFLLLLLLNSSPILLFYGANFIPDSSSLGLMLSAWYLFFRMHVPHVFLPRYDKWQHRLLFVLCLNIGIAAKTTCMIQWLTMAGVLVLSHIRYLKIDLQAKKQLYADLILALVIPVGWYFWSKHLADTHNSQYFMMRIPLSESFEAYRNAWLTYLANWPQQTFSEPLIYIAFALFFVVMLLKRFISPGIWFITMLNFSGSAAFLALMIEQFKYHDYYVICLFPCFAFSWIALADAMKRLRPGYWWVKVIGLVFVIWAFSHQYKLGTTNLRERYTEGNYWEQSHLRAEDYKTFRHQLGLQGIDRNACVIVGNDNAPNNMLYLLNLRGHRFSNDHDQERMHHIIKGSRPSYLISNDSSFTEKIRAVVDSLDQKASYKNLKAYRIIY